MIRIVHLYPKQMNIYGDMGNVIALTKRCQWRHIPVIVKNIDLHEALDLRAGDIIFMGGGQDKGQELVARDLKKHAVAIRSAVEAGTPALVICGGYQLFGHYFKSSSVKRLEGIGVFDAHTIAKDKRMIGNVVVQSKHFGELVGFENHSGQTYLRAKAAEMGIVQKGFGNNGEDTGEGAIYKNAIGTYLHGSFLPKNPQVADWLINAALSSLNQTDRLNKLDDRLEKQAHKLAAQRPQ